MAAVPKQMRAVQIKGGKGPSSSLYIAPDVAVPEAGADDVLVKVAVFGLNRMDLLQREGAYPVPPGASPIMGVEFSGHVVASPGGHFTPGDAVFGLATGGAYAEYITCPARMVLAKPDALSHEQAAAIPENFLTAYQALHRLAEMREGETVLVHAGASGVGLAAIQLARLLGAKRIFVTAGSADKCAFCEKLGADAAINYKETDWAAELAKQTDGRGVDVIMDFIGAGYFNQNLASLARDGRLVLQGMMGGTQVKDVNIGQLLLKRLRVEGSTLRSRDIEYQSSLVQDFVHSGNLDRLAEGVGREKTDDDVHHIVIHKVFSWNDIKGAHDEMAANKNTGKIVVTVD
ncbi:quinone oxidoreductase putative [Acaromyces ingoldii]|uniref:Quinone oxidoreductase putative n=1 Tax=Acaromyces ingoldii TaxID=215250 RepID=A0A316YTI8_9BASI|nr:quinone oxidoreductase putative [Acaromyces ingoldii]PWN92541.1 quinone oxidoreductase putative [Acaromyces ingoldii]